MAQVLNKQAWNFDLSQLNTEKLCFSRKIRHYVIGQVLGKGGFGSVYTAIDTHTGEKAAIKVIPILNKSKSQIFQIEEQVNILRRIDHPNIVRIYETFQTEQNYMIFMELLHGKQLFHHICEKGPMSENIASHIFYQMVCTVKYLHQRGIIHRDIKAENIIIDDKFNAKLIDFGLSTQNKIINQVQQFNGSPSYKAPELLQRKKYDGAKVDIWCFGVLLYVMLEATLPFNTKNPDKYKYIREMIWHAPVFSSQEARQLYQLIFVSSEDRITIDQILGSNFVKKYLSSSKKLRLKIFKNEIGKENHERAIILTSQILKINKQRVKRIVEEKQLGEIYSVFCLIIRKINMQNKKIEQFLPKQQVKKSNQNSLSKYLDLKENKRLIKSHLPSKKQFLYSSGDSLSKQLDKISKQKIIIIPSLRLQHKKHTQQREKYVKSQEKIAKNIKQNISCKKNINQTFKTIVLTNSKKDKLKLLQQIKKSSNINSRKNSIFYLKKDQTNSNKIELENLLLI